MTNIKYPNYIFSGVIPEDFTTEDFENLSNFIKQFFSLMCNTKIEIKAERISAPIMIYLIKFEYKILDKSMRKPRFIKYIKQLSSEFNPDLTRTFFLAKHMKKVFTVDDIP
jgi:hypothetical protein